MSKSGRLSITGQKLRVPVASPCLRVSVFIRVGGAAALLAAAISGGAGLLQWFWAGWSVYSGAGPAVPVRWLLTGAVGAALLLPPGAAMCGAAIGRRLADSGLRDQVRVTRWGTRRLAFVAVAWAVAPSWLAALLSAVVWVLVSLASHTSFHRPSEGAGIPAPVAIGAAHGLVAMMAAAFAVWGAALAVRARAPRGSAWGEWRRIGLWGPVALLLIAAGPALVGPLLPHLSRPERALEAVLLVNPATAVGAALGMDVLRSPRLYMLTRAPEYWYTYPPAAAVAMVYLTAAAAGGYHLRKGLEGD